MSKTSDSRTNASLAAPTRLLNSYLQEAAAKLARRREIVGDRIREAREAKGWLQKELARRVHVEPQTVSNWERGVTTPDLDTLEFIARELEHEMAWFLVEPATETGREDEIRALREELAEARGDLAAMGKTVDEVLRLLREQPEAAPEDQSQSG